MSASTARRARQRLRRKLFLEGATQGDRAGAGQGNCGRCALQQHFPKGSAAPSPCNPGLGWAAGVAKCLAYNFRSLCQACSKPPAPCWRAGWTGQRDSSHLQNQSRPWRSMSNKNALFGDIQRTGFALRDWLGPYYMLGGVVAFFITVFSLLDPSGWLVRWVAAGLFLLTVMAWVLFLYRQASSRKLAGANTAPADAGAKPHAILLAVTVFFLLGLLVSEVVLRGRNAGGPAAQQPSRPAPSGNAAALAPVPATAAAVAPSQAPANASPSAQPAKDEATASAPARGPASPPVLPQAAVQDPSASDTTAAAGSGTGTGTGTNTPKGTASVARAGQVNTRPEPRPPERPPAVRQVALQKPASKPAPLGANDNDNDNAEPTPSPAERQRCSSLLGRFSLGEELQPADKQFLRTSCR